MTQKLLFLEGRREYLAVHRSDIEKLKWIYMEKAHQRSFI